MLGVSLADYVNLVKLCVGVSSVEELAGWIARRGGQTASHTTRMRPKREAELLAGGSLYWVIKGAIQARQEVLGLEEVSGPDGKPHCRLVLSRDLIRTHNAPRRPFQGWRYLSAEDAPADLPKTRASEEPLPQELAQALADIGLL